MAASAEIEKAAQELVSRYGDQAVPFITHWADSLAREGMVKEETVALRVLNAAERLLMSRPQASPDLGGIAALVPLDAASLARPSDGRC